MICRRLGRLSDFGFRTLNFFPSSIFNLIGFFFRFFIYFWFFLNSNFSFLFLFFIFYFYFSFFEFFLEFFFEFFILFLFVFRSFLWIHKRDILHVIGVSLYWRSLTLPCGLFWRWTWSELKLECKIFAKSRMAPFFHFWLLGSS